MVETVVPREQKKEAGWVQAWLLQGQSKRSRGRTSARGSTPAPLVEGDVPEGVDYFSTLGYQPASPLAAGRSRR